MAFLTDALNTRRGRLLVENLTAYLFLFPAMLIIFVFGIFPVAFAFFVSLYRWERFPESYRALENYVDALGGLAFVLFFWLAIGMILYAVWQAWQQRRYWHYILPGVVNAAALALFTDWFFKILPGVLEVPRRIPRRVEVTRQVFIDEFNNTFRFPANDAAWDAFLMGLAAAVLVSGLTLLILRHHERLSHLLRATYTALLVIGGGWLLQLTLAEMDKGIDAARQEGADVPIWSYIILISAGALLVVAAYFLWRHAHRQHQNRDFAWMGAAALAMLTGGYLLITQVPLSLKYADDNLMQAFWVTLLYVAGTVPFQLAFGLGLSYLLFHAKTAKSFFRIIYFLPYVTPFAATAVVFAILFSGKPEGPINQLLDLVSIEPQTWLTQQKPVMELIFHRDLPRVLEGPGLALVVIMLWSNWTYIGYNTVVFMAGLGNISPEYYEAARIDGANGWNLFRYITLPLLSPTTFFLSLVAVVGTFQAFTQIWMMRKVGAQEAVDTVGVYLFETVSSRSNNGYAAAMAFVLFGIILIVTIVQNRVQGRNVFYG